MRIAILGVRGYPSTYGGFETFVRELAPRLAERGHQLSVYCRQEHLGRIRRDEYRGIERIELPGLSGTSLSTLSHGIVGIGHASIDSPDALLIVNAAHGLFLPWMGRNIPVLLCVDGVEWERGKWNRLGRGVFKLAALLSARWATGLVADSKAIAARWRAEFGVEAMYIPYGADIDTAPGTDALSQWHLEPDAYLLVVARLVPENNIDLILDAMALNEWRHELVVVGTGHERLPLVRRLRATALRNRRLRLLGHIDDQRVLRQLWASCNMYLHGHSVGGTNPALLQAMACGAPPIVFASPFNEEVVGEALWAHAWEDAATLAMRIRDVYDDKRLRSSMGASGVLRVEAEFSWDSVTDAFEDALTDIAVRTHERRRKRISCSR